MHFKKPNFKNHKTRRNKTKRNNYAYLRKVTEDEEEEKHLIVIYKY